MKRAFLLARVSTLKKTQDESPERQLETLREYAGRQKWEIVGEATERASGAKGETQRPALAQALSLARAGSVTAICVTRLDRLGRSLRNLLDTSEELRRLGCDLAILDLGLDTSTPSGRFMFSMLGAVAEFQRDLYGEAAAQGKARAEAAGKTCARPRETVQPEAILEIDRLRCAGIRWRRIPAMLASKGWKRWGRVIKSTGQNRPDAPWPVSSLQRAWTAWKATGEPNQKPPRQIGQAYREESQAGPEDGR